MVLWAVLQATSPSDGVTKETTPEGLLDRLSTRAGWTHSQPGLTSCPMALDITVKITSTYTRSAGA